MSGTASGVAISQLPAATAVLNTDWVPVVEIGTPNVTKRITVAQFLANTLNTSGGAFTGPVEFQAVATFENNVWLQWEDTTDTPQNVMALDASNNLDLRTYGTRFSFQNSAGTQLASIDTSGNISGNGVVTASNGMTCGSTGIVYSGYGTHRIAYSWDGSFINGIVDGTGIGQLATVGWANGLFATYSWVNGNFKPIGAYTPNQNVDSGSSPSFGNVSASGQVTASDVHSTGNVDVDNAVNVAGSVFAAGLVQGANIATSSVSSHTWGFYIASSCYIRADNTYDYGPIYYTSDGRLKRDIAPTEFDCLNSVQRIELKQFRWSDDPAVAPMVPRDDDHLVPVGFITQQLKDVLEDAVNVEPKGMPALPEGAVHYESVNHNTMLALLVGAVQQLAAKVDSLTAAAMKA